MSLLSDQILADHAGMEPTENGLSPFQIATPPHAPEIENREIVGVIGEGGMGTVYEARHLLLGRREAIKVIRGVLASQPALTARFLTEMRLQSRLSHPNVVPVLEMGKTDDGVYAVTEFVEGENLETVLARGTPKPAVGLGFILDAARGLAHAHAEGIVHRDVKPGNILIGNDGRARVCDFGLARCVDPEDDFTRNTRTGNLLGTPGYMAPEQSLDPRDVDGRADVFSLGRTLFRILVGRLPKDREDPGFEAIARIDRRLGTLVESMCRTERADRPRDMDSVVQELEALLPDLDSPEETALGHHPVPVESPGLATARKGDALADPHADSSSPRRISSPRALMALGVFGVLGVLGAVGVTFVGPRSPEAGVVRPSIRGQVDVRVWSPEDPSRRGRSVFEPGVLPLREGERIRVEAEADPASYLYLVWIGTDGEVSPVHPWAPGDWSSVPEERPLGWLSLPRRRDVGWPLTGEHGMETLVLLARHRPLPPDVDLRELLQGLPRQTAYDDRAVLALEGGRVETRSDRAPQFFNAQRIDDPVLQAQRWIAGELGPHFPLIRAISFANRGR